MVQAESISSEENLVKTGSVCQYRTGTAYQHGPKMHQVECISVDSTGISVCLFKAVVR